MPGPTSPLEPAHHAGGPSAAGGALSRRRFLSASLAALAAAGAAGRPRSAAAAGPLLSAPDGAVTAPYRSQFDGSLSADANCGPAALAMFLGRFGVQVPTAELRAAVNDYMRDWSGYSGSSWESLVYAANTRNYQQHGLYNPRSGYRTWSQDDIRAENLAGRPVMVLVRYQNLPGNAGSGFFGDHYVLILGRDPQGSIVYHDPAYSGTAGAYRRMTPGQLQLAWTTTSVALNQTAMGLHRLNQPRQPMLD